MLNLSKLCVSPKNIYGFRLNAELIFPTNNLLVFVIILNSLFAHKPFIQRCWKCFDRTFQRNIVRNWYSNQWPLHPYHWRNCEKFLICIIFDLQKIQKNIRTIYANFYTFRDTWWYAIGCDAQIGSHIQS